MASPDANLHVAARRSFWYTDSRARTLLLCLGLALATVAVYYQARTHPFSGLDDYLYLVDNPHVHNGLNWRTIWWSFRAMNMANWIPLTWMAYAFDYSLFAANPAGHHMVDVALHALNAIVLLLLLKRATGYTGRSFMVAALFALHPMNVESVVWVAELKSVLCMLFFLLALGAYRWYALKPRLSRYLVVAFLFGLGLAAKSQIITFPFVLVAVGLLAT